MNASRVNCTLVLATALLLGGEAFAQSGPVDLTPTGSQAPRQDPRPMEEPLEPPVDVQDGKVNRSVTGGTVEQEPLGQVDPDVAGVLNGENGGFGPAMWWGTDRRVIETFMAKLPVSAPSPAMHNLMRRLLLTGAEVPKGGQPGSLISLRAHLLAAMGDFQGVTSLLGTVPGSSANPDLLQVEMDTHLLNGDVTHACQMAHENIESQDTPYWQKAFTFCQILEGQQQAALLGLSLLEELGVNDPVFFQLVRIIAGQDKAAGKAPVLESLIDPSPLHLALAQVAKIQLPADVISSNRPGVLRAVAASPNAGAELRLEAAERAETSGALEVDALRQLYAGIEFTDDELKNPLTAAAKRSGPMSRALLYRSSLEQTVPAAQAETLSHALSMARTEGRYASAARAFLPQLSHVEASSDLAWFAPEAIRALLVTGHALEAEPWFYLLKQAAGRDPEMALALERLMPVARLAGFPGADSWTMDRLGAWWNFVKDTPGARENAAMLFSTFDAMGEFVPENIWLVLLDGPSHQSITAPHPSGWFLLEGASSQARIGETVLLSLVILGDAGPARVEPMIAHRVLKALRNIGLNDEARALALETVVAAGL